MKVQAPQSLHEPCTARKLVCGASAISLQQPPCSSSSTAAWLCAHQKKPSRCFRLCTQKLGAVRPSLSEPMAASFQQCLLLGHGGMSWPVALAAHLQGNGAECGRLKRSLGKGVEMAVSKTCYRPKAMRLLLQRHPQKEPQLYRKSHTFLLGIN